MNATSPLIVETATGDGPIAVVVKDCIDVAGLPTRAGSGCFADAPPARAHAEVVALILARGGRIVGKAHMHELAYGVTGVNDYFGTPLNPVWPDRIPGGSSSGSAAAVAAGLVAIAIGSDTGGSIRLPATCCGVFGLKPTFGRISRQGCTPEQSSLDCVGPLADNLDGIERAMQLIDPSFVPEPIRETVNVAPIAVRADFDVAEATARLVAASVTQAPVALESFEAAYRAGLTIMASECWRAFGALTGDERMGPDVRARLLAAARVTPDAVADAEEVRTRFTAEVDELLATADVLVLPTLPSVPPTLTGLAADPAIVLDMTALVRPFNLSGHPALTIPVRTDAGLPAGVQIVSRKGGDAFLIAVARRLLDTAA